MPGRSEPSPTHMATAPVHRGSTLGSSRITGDFARRAKNGAVPLCILSTLEQQAGVAACGQRPVEGDERSLGRLREGRQPSACRIFPEAGFMPAGSEQNETRSSLEQPVVGAPGIIHAERLSIHGRMRGEQPQHADSG